MAALMVVMAAPAMAKGTHLHHHHNDNEISVSFGGFSIEQD
jgi:hypothetical protein